MREVTVGVVSLALTIAVSGISGALGGLLYARYQKAPSPVVVVDMRKLLDPVVRDGSLDDAARLKRTAQIGTAISQVVEHHVAAGTVVLDGSAVLRAPQELYVQP